MKIPFNCDSVKLTSGYGSRVINGVKDNHKGYDLVGVGSKEVVAVEGGTVVRSRIVTDKSNSTWQWGNYICIKTNSGTYNYYCHLASRNVAEGQKVEKGQLIGIMGNTGYAFGAHLHFEVREGDGMTTINPEYVLNIPNKTGKYTIIQLDKDLDTIQQAGIVNSPDYWKIKADEVKYFKEFIHNVAEYVRKVNK